MTSVAASGKAGSEGQGARQLLAWGLVVAAVALLAGWRGLQPAEAPTVVDDGRWLLLPVAVAAALLVPAAMLLRRPLVAWLDDDAAAAWQRERPLAALFVLSFVALFVEVLLIRYATSQIRVFSFYKNVPLIAAYLGLGIGCWESRGRPRHALSFLVWALPLCALLAVGPQLFGDLLGVWAAEGSSEHILGDLSPSAPALARTLAAQAALTIFCALTFVAFTLLFLQLGRLLGESFERVPRLVAYSVNIAGSLVGIAAFLVLCALQTAPWLWLLVGLTPLVWWLAPGRQRALGAALVALCVAAAVPSFGETVWSRYQKLVGHRIPPGPSGSGSDSPAFLVEISDVFYQQAFDLRPVAVAQRGQNPMPLYDDVMRTLPPGARVLVVGAGTGNDVAAALRANAASVDAVDIDPAIIDFGRRYHPERPYDDPRVRVIVDDARAAFHRLPAGSYDAVVFGLLDSHSQLGISSVRLDNYVFTVESLAAARRLLRPGGALLLTAATFRPWFRARLGAMLATACDGQLRVSADGAWTAFACTVQTPAETRALDEATLATLPTDDWPFLYLPTRGVPAAYLVVLAALVGAALLVLRRRGLRLARLDAEHAHLFFLGAAFLLMEVYAINRLALLFGTTWLVSALTIAVVLTLILGANLLVALTRLAEPRLAYLGLVVGILAGLAIDVHAVLGLPLAFQLGYAALLLSPVLFAGIVFARSFSAVSAAGAALGANMLGAVLGGWIEYGVMLVGIRSLGLLALLLYAASALALLRHRQRAAPTA